MVQIQILRAGAQVPKRATQGSAGYDLAANITAPVVIAPRERLPIPTGIAIALEEGTAAFIFGRSSLGAKHGIVPANAVGVIDSDYRGELIVVLSNQSTKPYTIQPDERIAQMVMMPILTPVLHPVDDLPSTLRGSGGFGSSGVLATEL